MGIREELLPADYQESRTLYDAIRAHQAGPSTSGQALTAALMNLLEGLMPPGTRHLPVILTRYLVGSETAAMIGLRQAPYRDRIQFWFMLRAWQGIVAAAGVFHKDRPYRFASEWLHRRLMDRMGNLPGHAPFQIPSEFIQQWFPADTARNTPPSPI
jgi:hypothetical protein